MMNGELDRFSQKSEIYFHPFSIFSHSHFLQFSQTGKLLIFFLPLQICVNPRLSAAKKSFPFLYEFSGLKSKSLKRRSDQRYAHFSTIGM